MKKCVCMVFLGAALLWAGILVSDAPLAAQVAVWDPPIQRFYLDFPQLDFNYNPTTTGIEMSTQALVVSYGGDSVGGHWVRANASSTLFHLKHIQWGDVYWEVDAMMKDPAVYRVTQGHFGELPGKRRQIKHKLDYPVEITYGGGGLPTRIDIKIPGAYLVHTPSSGAVQIAAPGGVHLAGADWDACQVAPNLFHLKIVSPMIGTDAYWKVRTTQGRERAYRTTGGKFCRTGGMNEIDTPLNVSVRVVR